MYLNYFLRSRPPSLHVLVLLIGHDVQQSMFRLEGTVKVLYTHTFNLNNCNLLCTKRDLLKTYYIVIESHYLFLETVYCLGILYFQWHVVRINSFTVLSITLKYLYIINNMISWLNVITN